MLTGTALAMVIAAVVAGVAALATSTGSGIASYIKYIYLDY